MVPFRIAAQTELQDQLVRVALTGGGSGGHVYPGLAVLEALRTSTEAAGIDLDPIWIGGDALEAQIVPRAGVPYARIPTGKLRRYFSLRNVTDLFRVIGGIFAASSVLRRQRSQVLFSKGGFVSVPAVIAARMRGIPVVSHESDADPGLATRINSRFSTLILVAYESVVPKIRESLRPRVKVSGNPLRSSITQGTAASGLRAAGFTADDARPVMLVLGGSQGATQVNLFIERNLASITKTWRIIHQCGDASEPLAQTPSYFGRKYFDHEMPDLLATADLVLCRSGAGTLWEAAACGKPLVMVPLVAGSRGDQIRNARLFADSGAGVSIVTTGDEQSDDVSLMRALAEFEDASHRAHTGARAQAFASPGAAAMIAREVLAFSIGGSQP